MNTPQEIAQALKSLNQRRSKYGAVPVTVQGRHGPIRFASQREYHRYMQLRVLVSAGEITQLRLQVPYPLHVAGVKVATYIADFEYIEALSGVVVTEDAKGFATPVYKLKRRMLEAEYGIEIQEV